MPEKFGYLFQNFSFPNTCFIIWCNNLSEVQKWIALQLCTALQIYFIFCNFPVTSPFVLTCTFHFLCILRWHYNLFFKKHLCVVFSHKMPIY